MLDYNKRVCAKMITGAESGGQVYGQGKWDYVKPPKIGKEVTLTLGAYQFYGDEGQKLIQMIFDENPSLIPPSMKNYVFLRNWVADKWNPNTTTRNLIGQAISTPVGIQKQIELFCDIQMPEYIKHAEEFGITDEYAQMMWVEIEHLGGTKAAKRIFKRILELDNKPTTSPEWLSCVMVVLHFDQYNTSSDNEVGDKLYWSRHEFCQNCIIDYAIPSGAVQLFDGAYIAVEE
jgi:hypothetical protein